MHYKDIADKLGSDFSATQIAGWLHNNKKILNYISDKVYKEYNLKSKVYSETEKNIEFIFKVKTLII